MCEASFVSSVVIFSFLFWTVSVFVLWPQTGIVNFGERRSLGVTYWIICGLVLFCNKIWSVAQLNLIDPFKILFPWNAFLKMKSRRGLLSCHVGNKFWKWVVFVLFFCFSFRYSEGEIRFNLMAIVSDRKMIYEQRIAELQQQLAEVRHGI